MPIDYIIIFGYLIVINAVGILYAGSKSVKGYFLGDRSIPWGIACFSIVATETSTLTFLSIPGLAYVQGMGFLQVAFGYLLGRILVAFFLIPKYFEGRFQTVYAFLESRFSPAPRKMISFIFHGTRLLADSVRLFATAIPLSVMTGWDYWISILVIGAATCVYTFYGGLRSVVVVDTVQLFLYISCVVLGILIVSDYLSVPVFSLFRRIPKESLRIVTTGMGKGFAGLFDSYTVFSGLIGGAFLSFASHGTDHLMVQRVLSCKDERAAQKAMIFSGVMINVQFFLFLLFGLIIKVYFQNTAFDRSDEVVPYFIVHRLPDGVRGVMLAGIFAAAMSTLSSSINSLSSSTVVDLLEVDKKNLSDFVKVRISKIISLFWAAMLVGISLLFRDTKNPLVEVGLSIASITYGGMMGIFLIGRFFSKVSDRAAMAGVTLGIVGNVLVVTLTSVFWLWYVVIGVAVTIGSAFLLSFFRKFN